MDTRKKVSILPEKYGFKLILENEISGSVFKDYSLIPYKGLEIELNEMDGNTFTLKYRMGAGNGWHDCAFRYECNTVEQFEYLLYNGGLSQQLKAVNNKS